MPHPLCYLPGWCSFLYLIQVITESELRQYEGIADDEFAFENAITALTIKHKALDVTVLKWNCWEMN